MTAPRIGSLFSGYGGLDMGVQAVLGGDVVWNVEYDAAPSKILDHHWPDVPNYGDVTTLDLSTVDAIDILTAGYPCQPFSIAGKRKGSNDERHLWPYVLDAIRYLRPGLVVLENVRGHLSMGFDRVLGDLAEAGYDTQWECLPASEAGAPHRRERIFILAQDPNSPARNQRRLTASGQAESGWSWPDVGGRSGTSLADSSGNEPERWGVLRNLGGPQTQDERTSGQWERIRNTTGDSSATSSDADNSGLEGRPRATQRANEQSSGPGGLEAGTFGIYESAIRRWERILGRFAPAATVPNERTGKHRLNPAFVEFMMGLPAGHITDPAIGLTRNEQLKALGNGVVPQQAALALSLLLPELERAA